MRNIEYVKVLWIIIAFILLLHALLVLKQSFLQNCHHSSIQKINIEYKVTMNVSYFAWDITTDDNFNVNAHRWHCLIIYLHTYTTNDHRLLIHQFISSSIIYHNAPLSCNLSYISLLIRHHRINNKCFAESCENSERWMHQSRLNNSNSIVVSFIHQLHQMQLNSLNLQTKYSNLHCRRYFESDSPHFTLSLSITTYLSSGMMWKWNVISLCFIDYRHSKLLQCCFVPFNDEKRTIPSLAYFYYSLWVPVPLARAGNNVSILFYLHSFFSHWSHSSNSSPFQSKGRKN